MIDPNFTSLESLRARPKGAVRLFSIRGVPVDLHWTSFRACLFIVFIAFTTAGGAFNPRIIPWLIVGYFIVIAVHEAGHAVAAMTLGSRVYAVRLRGTGGVCLAESPKRARDALIVCSSGVLAQTALLCVTLLYLHWAGPAPGGPTTGLIFAFTFGNCILLLSSLVPWTTRDGLSSDGKILARLLRDRWQGRTYISFTLPGIKGVSSAPIFRSDTSLLSVEKLTPPNFRQGLEILSDLTTPLQFVVEVFRKHLDWDAHTALIRAIEIHNRGGMLWPLANFEEAKRIAAAIAEDVADAQYALVCRAVKREV